MSFVWLRDVALDWVIISLAIFLGCSYWYLIPVAIYIVGNRQHALLIIGHDSTHKLVSKNPKINYLFGNFLCFAPLGLAWEGYRDFHMLHHRWLGTDKDPELEKKKRAGCIDSNLNRKYLVIQFIKDLLFLNTKDLIHFSVPKSKSDWMSIIPFQVVIISLGLVNILIPVIWYAALVSSLLATARLRIFHEHVAADHTHLIKPTVFSRLLFLPHNAAYHHEHHEKSSIPYNKLHLKALKNRRLVSKIHG